MLAKLARADAELHRETEDIHELMTGMADEMGAENTVAATIQN